MRFRKQAQPHLETLEDRCVPAADFVPQWNALLLEVQQLRGQGNQQAARALLERGGADPEFAAAYNKYRLASGALAWQLAEQFPPRAWEAWKGLKGVPGVDSELEQARRRDAALAQAQRDEPARFERFAARIAALGQRLQTLLPQVTALQREQQQVVQELAVAQLVRQKERLAEYTTQARFAVAQLYDRAHLSRSEDHAKP